MLVRADVESPHSADEQLAALVGRQVFWSESTHPKGTEIFGEGEEANFVYRVVTGAVRTYKLLSDGRRQISSFHLPGDIFGLEDGLTHRFTAEAAVVSTVRLIRRYSLFDSFNCLWSGWRTQAYWPCRSQPSARRKPHASLGTKDGPRAGGCFPS